jgi:hypothetical protein
MSAIPTNPFKVVAQKLRAAMDLHRRKCDAATCPADKQDSTQEAMGALSQFMSTFPAGTILRADDADLPLGDAEAVTAFHILESYATEIARTTLCRGTAKYGWVAFIELVSWLLLEGFGDAAAVAHGYVDTGCVELPEGHTLQDARDTAMIHLLHREWYCFATPDQPAIPGEPHAPVRGSSAYGKAFHDSILSFCKSLDRLHAAASQTLLTRSLAMSDAEMVKSNA